MSGEFAHKTEELATPKTVASNMDEERYKLLLEFKKEQIKLLQQEVVDLARQAHENYRYAILASGAAFAWLASLNVGDRSAGLPQVSPEILKLAWFIPMVLSGFFGLVTVSAWLRMLDIKKFLGAMEDALVDNGKYWEALRFGRRFPLFRYLAAVGWAALIIGDAAVAFLVVWS